jgi:hypothetical protein
MDENVFADECTRVGSRGGVLDVEVDLRAGAAGGLLDNMGLASGPEVLVIQQPLKGSRNIVGGSQYCFCAVTEDSDIVDLKITGGLRELDPELLLRVGEG